MTRKQVQFQVEKRVFSAAARTWDKVWRQVRPQISQQILERTLRDIFLPPYSNKIFVYREIQDEVDRLINL